MAATDPASHASYKNDTLAGGGGALGVVGRATTLTNIGRSAASGEGHRVFALQERRNSQRLRPANVMTAMRNNVEQVHTAGGRAGPCVSCSNKMTEVTRPPEERTANL